MAKIKCYPKEIKKYDFLKCFAPITMATASKLMKLVYISCKFFSVTFQRIPVCNTSYESLCNCPKLNKELFSISSLEFAQMPKISFSMTNYEILDILSSTIFFMTFFNNLSVRFQCLSSPVHMPIFMEILHTVIKNKSA